MNEIDPVNLGAILAQPTMSVGEAVAVTGLCRSTVYKLCNVYRATAGRDGIPCRWFGNTVRVLTVPLSEMLGLDVRVLPSPVEPPRRRVVADKPLCRTKPRA